MSDLNGTWSVEATNGGSRFTIVIEAKVSGSFPMRTLFKMAAKRQFRVALADLADGWAARMEREARA